MLSKKEQTRKKKIRDDKKLETKEEIKAIWNGWRDTVSWYIDQLIALLNSGRNVLQTFAG